MVKKQKKKIKKGAVKKKSTKKKTKQKTRRMFQPIKFNKPIVLSIIISVTLLGSFLGIALFSRTKMDMFQTTGGGEFDFQLMGVKAKNPYDKSRTL